MTAAEVRGKPVSGQWPGEITRCLEDGLPFVPELGQARVALTTEKAAHLIGFVVVIDAEVLTLRTGLLANGADTVLLPEHGVELFPAQSVVVVGHEVPVASAAGVSAFDELTDGFHVFANPASALTVSMSQNVAMLEESEALDRVPRLLPIVE